MDWYIAKDRTLYFTNKEGIQNFTTVSPKQCVEIKKIMKKFWVIQTFLNLYPIFQDILQKILTEKLFYVKNEKLKNENIEKKMLKNIFVR